MRGSRGALEPHASVHDGREAEPGRDAGRDGQGRPRRDGNDGPTSSQRTQDTNLGYKNQQPSFSSRVGFYPLWHRVAAGLRNNYFHGKECVMATLLQKTVFAPLETGSSDQWGNDS